MPAASPPKESPPKMYAWVMSTPEAQLGMSPTAAAMRGCSQ